jgi:predicted O-methyltransferase YrrM
MLLRVKKALGLWRLKKLLLANWASYCVRPECYRWSPPGKKVPCFPEMTPVDKQTFRWLVSVKKKLSMLHVDTLMALRHLVRTTTGAIVEIGPYVGGSTIVMARALQETGRKRPFLSIEVGGANPNHWCFPTNDILADLQRNLCRYGVQDLVQIVVGWSYDPHVIAVVAAATRQTPIELLVFDANGAGLEQELERFAPYCFPGCFLVCDDYIESDDIKLKAAHVKPALDRLVRSGSLEPIGVLPWGTWFGRMAA